MHGLSDNERALPDTRRQVHRQADHPRAQHEEGEGAAPGRSRTDQGYEVVAGLVRVRLAVGSTRPRPAPIYPSQSFALSKSCRTSSAELAAPSAELYLHDVVIL